MPVNFQDLLSSSDVNNTFLDKTIADTKTGQLTLQKNVGDPTAISDVQETINSLTPEVVANQLLIASDTINKSDNKYKQVRRLSGSGAAITTATTPFGDSSNTLDGTVIILRGTDSTNTVTVENQDIQYGVILNGNATLQNYYEIELMYDAIAERWIEQRRNF